MFQTRISARLQENLEENGLESATNPMMNLVILTKVFNQIPFRLQDFQQFRLVCRVWMEASLPRWRRNAWLSVRDHNCYRRSNNHIKISECQKMEEYLLDKHPFRRYKISLTKSLHLSENIYRLGEGSARFWSQFGSHITHLKLYDSQIISKEAVKKILLEMTPNLIFLCFENNPINDKKGVVPVPLTEDEWSNCTTPTWHDKLAPLPCEVQHNLSHLEIRLGSGTKGFEFPIAWVYFLARCPNLKTLKLREFSQWCRWGTLGEELEYFLKAILLIRERCNPACLEKLQVLDLLHSSLSPEPRFPTDVLLLLRYLRFPLSSLAVDVGFQSGDVFKQILELYPSSLRKLLLYVGPVISRIRRPQFNQFPLGVDFNALTELRLIGPTVKNLHFLQNFSNLRVLVLLSGLEEMETVVLHSYVDFWRDSVNDKVSEVCASVLSETVYHVVAATNFLGEELRNCVLTEMQEFVVGNELCAAEQVVHLGKMMPNLKKLRLGLERDGFNSACRMWTQLEHLDVNPFAIDEDGLMDAQLYQKPSWIDLKFFTWFRIDPPLVGKRDSVETEKSLKLITETIQSTPNTKDLHFTGTATVNFNTLALQSTTTMDNLPPEVLTPILEHATFNQRRNALLSYRLVCRQFQHIMDYLMEKKICSGQLPPFPEMTPATLRSTANPIPFKSAALTSNSVNNQSHSIHFGFIPASLGSQLTSFSLQNHEVDLSFLVAVLESMPNLKLLSLSSVKLSSPTEEASLSPLPRQASFTSLELKNVDEFLFKWFICYFADQLISLRLESDLPLPALQRQHEYLVPNQPQPILIGSTSESAFGKLKVLKISGPSANFLRLSETPVLQRFSLTDFISTSVRFDMDEFVRFIGKCRETLKFLSLDVAWNVELVGLGFDILPPFDTRQTFNFVVPGLTTLEIHASPLMEIKEYLFHNFLSLFPALEVIYVYVPPYQPSTPDEHELFEDEAAALENAGVLGLKGNLGCSQQYLDSAEGGFRFYYQMNGRRLAQINPRADLQHRAYLVNKRRLERNKMTRILNRLADLGENVGKAVVEAILWRFSGPIFSCVKLSGVRVISSDGGDQVFIPRPEGRFRLSG